MAAQIQTPLTKMLNIAHPVMLAGMGVSAGPPLAAAVTNAGGIGVLGGFSATPERLRELIRELKELLVDKNAPFGVDLLLPKIGGAARKTNYDYTDGQLDELITVCTEEKAQLIHLQRRLPRMMNPPTTGGRAEPAYDVMANNGKT